MFMAKRFVHGWFMSHFLLHFNSAIAVIFSWFVRDSVCVRTFVNASWYEGAAWFKVDVCQEMSGSHLLMFSGMFLMTSGGQLLPAWMKRGILYGFMCGLQSRF